MPSRSTGHVDDVGLRRHQHGHGAGVGRALADHAIAGIEQHAREQVERLLAARGDEQVGRLGRRARVAHARREPLAQVGEPLGRAVLQRLGAALARDALGQLDEQARRERRGPGEAAGERDHARPLGDGHQIAHRGRAHAGHALGVAPLVRIEARAGHRAHRNLPRRFARAGRLLPAPGVRLSAPMAASIEPFLRMRSAALVGHLPSGELAYLSDQTGSLQLYVARADGLHDQLTFGEDRVTGAVRSRIDERIVLARDVGGNERHALACLDARAAASCALTRRSRGDPLARRVRTRRLDVRVHAHRAERRRLRSRARGPRRQRTARARAAAGRVQRGCDWSERGILLWRMNTPFDHDLFLVDPRDGRLRAPDAARGRDRLRVAAAARRRAASRAPATPAGSSRVSRSSRDGAPPEFRTPDDADVDSVRVDGTRTHIAHVVNRGGPSELWLDGDAARGTAARRLRRRPSSRSTDASR